MPLEISTIAVSVANLILMISCSLDLKSSQRKVNCLFLSSSEGLSSTVRIEVIRRKGLNSFSMSIWREMCKTECLNTVQTMT